jgi:hypothetical protein
MSIQRGSAKHGPRLDDEQKHETEGLVRGTGTTRAQEWNETEPSQRPEDDMIPRRRPPGHEPGSTIGITPADVERRSNLAKWLSDARYPADAHDLLTHAEAKNAPDAVLQAVRDLPDLKYQNVGQVAEALGLGVERHRW